MVVSPSRSPVRLAPGWRRSRTRGRRPDGLPWTGTSLHARSSPRAAHALLRAASAPGGVFAALPCKVSRSCATRRASVFRGQWSMPGPAHGDRPGRDLLRSMSGPSPLAAWTTGCQAPAGSRSSNVFLHRSASSRWRHWDRPRILPPPDRRAARPRGSLTTMHSMSGRSSTQRRWVPSPAGPPLALRRLGRRTSASALRQLDRPRPLILADDLESPVEERRITSAFVVSASTPCRPLMSQVVETMPRRRDHPHDVERRRKEQ